jgi:hypothetical protein
VSTNGKSYGPPHRVQRSRGPRRPGLGGLSEFDQAVDKRPTTVTDRPPNAEYERLVAGRGEAVARRYALGPTD